MARACTLPRFCLAAAVLLVAEPQLAAAADQASQDQYVAAASRLYSAAIMPGLAKDWCDARVPDTAAANAPVLEDWKARNQVQAIEDSVLARLPRLKDRIASIRQSANASLDSRIASPAGFCRSFPAYIAQQGQLDVKYANELKIINRRDDPAKPNGVATSQKPAGTAGKPSRDFDVGVSATSLEGVYYHTVQAMVYGGYVGFTTRPVFPLKDGTLFDSGTPPERWRMEGGNLVFISKDNNKTTARQWTRGVPARSRTFSGRFSSLDGMGTLAIGGSDAVMNWNSFRFLRDGHFSRNTGANSTTTGGNRETVTASSASFDGEYSLDGYFINLRYNDGHTVRTFFAFVTGEQDPAVISIGNKMFTCEKDNRGRCLP